jgi:hypothetical protein
VIGLFALVLLMGFWLPAPLFELVQQTAHIIGGAQ